MKNAYITPANITLAINFNFKCLRATTGKRIENVSLTESGLTWTIDKLGRSLYYNPSTTKFQVTTWTVEGKPNYITAFVGKKDRNKFYEVVDYIPTNWIDDQGNPIGVDKLDINFKYLKKQAVSKQLAELTFLDKAVRMGLFKSSYDK